MITWLQRVFDRHKYLVVILFGLVIVSFVFVINESGGFGGADSRTREQIYFGVNISSAKEIHQLQRDVLLVLLLEGIDPSNVPVHMVDPIWMNQRLPMLHLAKELNLPGPPAEVLPSYLARFPVFRNEDGSFSQSAYTAFLDRIDSSPQFTLEQLSRVLVEQYQISQVEQIVFGGAYIPEFHRTKFLEQHFTSWDVRLASLDFKGFNPEIKVTDEDLEAYYRTHSARYEIPEKLAGYAVAFRVKAFLPEGNVEEGVLKNHYERNLSRFIPTAKEGEEVAIPEFEAVKEKVLEDYRQRQALRRASEAAGDFISYLYEAKTLPEADALTAAAASHHAEVQELPAFHNGEVPEGVALPREVLSQLFRTSDRFYTDPIQHEGDYIILVRSQVIPRELPSLADRKAEVEADYRLDERRRLFREHGNELAQQLRKQVSEGGDFTVIAQELGFAVKDYSGVSLLEKTEGFPEEAAIDRELPRLNVQNISPFVSGAEAGYVIQVVDKKVSSAEENSFIARMLSQQFDYFYRQFLPTSILRNYIEDNMVIQQ